MDTQTSKNGTTTDHNSWQNKSKEEIKEILRSGKCIVKFTKLDGTEREMNCTLHPDYMPAQLPKDDTAQLPKRAQSEFKVSVWDLEANGWRSFRIDSLLWIKGFENYDEV